MALALKKGGGGQAGGKNRGGGGGGGVQGRGGGGGGQGGGGGGGKGKAGGNAGNGNGGGGGKMGLAGALKQARMAALAFRKATVRILGLTLAEPKSSFDATDSAGRRLKLRVRGAKGEIKGPLRLGPDKAEWDAMALVVLDARYRAQTVFEADRAAVKAAAGDKPRLPPAEFRKIATKVWEAEAPEE